MRPTMGAILQAQKSIREIADAIEGVFGGKDEAAAGWVADLRAAATDLEQKPLAPVCRQCGGLLQPDGVCVECGIFGPPRRH